MAAQQLTDAQFQQLLQRVGGGGNKRKLATFASGDSTEWLQWRAGFANINALNGWDDANAVAHIKAAMTGYAAMAVQGIHHDNPAELLNLYEAKFCTAAASVQARQQFLSAKQEESESITAWHTRVKMLYRRADVGANTETTKELIDRFIFGLSHATVMERTLDARPANMTDALAEAANRAATLATIKEMHGRKPGVGLHSMNGNNTNSGLKSLADRKCYNCDTPGHLAKDCRQPKRTDKVNKAFDDAKGRGRRGRNNKRRGGNNNGNSSGNFNTDQKVSVNSIVEALSKMQLVDDDAGEGSASQENKGQGN